MRGLLNAPGTNQCWLNSAFSCIIHTPAIGRIMISGPLYIGECAITRNFQYIARQLFDKEKRDLPYPVDANCLHIAFCEKFPSFSDNTQHHDAQEAILLFIQVFESSLKLKIFEGELSTGICSTIILPVTEPCSLEDVLVGTKVIRWPEIIMFTFSMYEYRWPVTLPFEFMNKQIYAVLMHKGSEDIGHYAALIKVRDEWYIKEDDKIGRLPNIEVLRGEFYCAF
jgi:ubiquitin C-terminal hydrolase